jgi:hypothetical protein
MHTIGSPIQIQTPKQCNLIGRSPTAQPPVLSPCGILQSPSSHKGFHSRKEARLKMSHFKFFLLILKLPKSEIA